MERYPFDNNGNLLPGLAVVGGQIVSQSGQVIPKWVASDDAVAAHLDLDGDGVPDNTDANNNGIPDNEEEV